MRKKPLKIEVCEEPEIQYAATPELFAEIRDWLDARGGKERKSAIDSSVYYDTENLRLLREGIEYRVKEKGKKLRHDLKTPLDPATTRAAVPDENAILWRNEFKCETSPKTTPKLAMYFGQVLLAPVQDRVRRFFDKTLEPKCRARFSKVKIDYEPGDEHDSRIEYSFQEGRMMDMKGERRTDLLHILELELRDGDVSALLAEKQALEEVFSSRGLALLPQRKIMMGIGLLQPSMTAEQRRAYQDALGRNGAENNGDLKRYVA